jgi:hypothetical protein
MIIFCLSVHHLWGRTRNKHNQDACAVAYADHGTDALSCAGMAEQTGGQGGRESTFPAVRRQRARLFREPSQD